MKQMKMTNVDSFDDVQNLLADEDWVMQQKMDGTFGRAVLRHGEPPMMTQDGETPLKHSAAVQHLPQIWEALLPMQLFLTVPGDEIIVEGEIMIRTGHYRLFDCVSSVHGGVTLVAPDSPWWKRNFALEGLSTLLGPSVSTVSTATSSEAKGLLFVTCRDRGVEGVVFKKRTHPYLPGARTKDVLKFKFVKTADVVVMKVDRPDPKHGSFTFGVHDGSGELRTLGSCSAIGKPDAQVGDVIEVAYLYRDPAGGGLIQPRMVRIREDKSPAECKFDQFQTYSREAV